MKKVEDLKEALQKLQEKQKPKNKISSLLEDHEILLETSKDLEKSYKVLQEKYILPKVF